MNADPATRARLVGLFVAEAEESLASLRELAGRLRGAQEAEALRDFGRIAHGLKGAAASLGYEALAGALHGLEDLALGIPEEGPAGAEARRRRVTTALDLIGEGVARMAASGTDAFPEDLLVRLRREVGAPDPGEPGGPVEVPPPANEAAPGNGSGRGPEAAERISVPADEVDAALRLASSLARSASQLHEALARAGAELAPAAQSLSHAAGGLEGIIASLRLLPAEAALSGLEEEVAALAGQLGKRVALVVTGREVRADRRTLQAARGMIRHLLRNAVDHGLEKGAVRLAVGKPEEGHLAVDVAAGESVLRVTVADDGAGFDTDAIRAEMARRSGEPDRIASLSNEEVLRIWAFEGGSTRASATQISGRGLGLSAVAQMARAAGGGIRIRTVPGEGSLVDFNLPLEVYAVEALTVSAGGRLFALPLAAVERTVHVAASNGAIHEGPTGRTLAVGETILPLGSLAAALGVEVAAAPERFAVVVRSEGTMAAFTVEEVGAVEGMVPASVPGVAQADSLVTGLARLGDGGAVALLNPRLLVGRGRERSSRTSPRPVPVEEVPVPAVRPSRALEVVLAEDSLATREVLRVLLEEQGFRVRVAADGEEALQRISERAPDVLVSDVNMPRRDGLALARALRSRSDTERLPIVLLTSQDDDATRAAGAAAGADAYLVKSRFNASVLHDTLSRIGVRVR